MRKKLQRLLALTLVFASVGFTGCDALLDKLPFLNGSDTASEQSGKDEHTHILTKRAGVEPTCEKEGKQEYWECLDCKDVFADKKGEKATTHTDLILPATGHTIQSVERVEPTETTAGNIAYWFCGNCDTYYSDEACETVIEQTETTLPKLSHVHKLIHHEAVAAKGEQKGNIEHWSCEGCKKNYADAEAKKILSSASIYLESPYDVVDFVVEVEEGRNPVVLQLTDTQIIDAGQARPGRDGVDTNFWATDQVEERCYDYVKETIERTKPDLILLTGDIIYGEFDDNGTALLSFVEFMESFETPWAPVFGNHDQESKKGADWQCAQFENAEYCLFEQKTLTGNGNYSVAIAQGEEIKRVFYMLDSNGCGNVSAESLANGHTTATVGFGQDQIQWYTNQITMLKKSSPNTKISFAYHIQQAIFEDAFEKYGFNQAEKYQDINIDLLQNKEAGDFGYIGRQLKGPWDTGRSVWKGMKALGADSLFVGHEHCNSASVMYEGVRFQFGQKSSEYDRFNCVDSTGTITGGYSKTGTSLIGGTVMPMSEEDGSFSAPYIYLCDNAGGKIDWSQFIEYEVNGIQKGSDGLYGDGAVTIRGIQFDETTNAYEVVANSQGKLYVNTNLLRGKTKFTFSLYVEKVVGTGLLAPFSIRVKPDKGVDDPAASIAGMLVDGNGKYYIRYRVDDPEEAVCLKLGTWQTFTVDITAIAADCTEFAFNIGAGNTLYLKDVALS